MTEIKTKAGTKGATNPRPGDFPLGSPQSRAAARLRLQGTTGLGRSGEECICFPAEEEPMFRTDSERAIAATLKCPLHGQRFPPPRAYLYRPPWLYERWYEYRFPLLSAQFKKAWNATFPPDLWPAEIVNVGGKLMLRLKDRALLDAPDEEMGLSGATS